MARTTAAPSGEASYSVLARVLNALNGYDPPVTRNRVYEWAKRKTPNQRGQSFPDPVREILAADRRKGQPSYLWDVREVLAWAEGGLPVAPWE